MAKDQGVDPTVEMYVSLASGAAASGNWTQAWQMVDIIEGASETTSSHLMNVYSIPLLQSSSFVSFFSLLFQFIS